MKNLSLIRKSGARGAPSGFVISLLFHAAAFFVAGLFVVFTVVNKSEPEFTPPPAVQRPKMNLKKPRVKVQKSSQPKPSSRIVAKVKTREMPEIQLPDLMGTGEGLFGGAGLGGEFIDLPEIGETTVFGGEESIGNDLRVTYYNLNLNRRGGQISMDPVTYESVIREFVRSGWDKTKLSKYYRSPRTLYATTIMIPVCPSTVAPDAFGEDLNYGYCWAALYEGKLVHKDDITFRFWGAADDVLTVAVDGEVVLAANWPNSSVADHWSSSAAGNYAHFLGNQYRVGGDWITLKAGVPRDLMAIVGEAPGGEFGAQLLVEVKGEEYPVNRRGAKIFPIFAMETPTWELQDSILINLTEGEANVTNVTTVFKDY